MSENLSQKELENLRIAGRKLAEIFEMLKRETKPGVSEKQLDDLVGKAIKDKGAIATYRTPEVNFPGNICISTNDVIVHGIPSARILQTGDVVSFDLVIEYGGMKADSAFTMVVGEQPTGAKKVLLNTTERSLYAGIKAIRGAVMTGTIGAAVEKVLDSEKLGVVRDLVGHGVGRLMHEDPDVPNYGRKGTGDLVPVGASIAIEPMTTLGTWKIKQDNDGWTIRTRDGSLSAHFEHTVVITECGAEIITKL
ncbi:MAG: type I methionyl aminopeptidase [Candidatus Nomurabacteria bacterium]|jgi:methionyl aminopeptidase|nr:type I methionyl aminopeptidase [Candidatus Nomurabacteria bacterium]